MTSHFKTPLGVPPEFIWRESRVKAIVAAMSRRQTVNPHPIPLEWIEELDRHARWLDSHFADETFGDYVARLSDGGEL